MRNSDSLHDRMKLWWHKAIQSPQLPSDPDEDRDPITTFDVRQRLDEVEITHQEVRDLQIEIADHVSDLKACLENELRQTQRRAEIISETVQDAILSTDCRGLITYANQSATDIFGYTKEEILAKNIDELVEGVSQAQRLQREAQFMCTFIADKGCSTYEESQVAYKEFLGQKKTLLDQTATLRGRCKNGDIVDIEYRVNAFNPNASTAHNVMFMIVIKDITDKLRALEKIDALTQMQLGLLSSVPNPIFYKDAEFKILGCNKSFYQLFQTHEDQIIGRKFSDFLGEESSKQCEDLERSLVHNHRGEVVIKQMKIRIGVQEKVVVVYCTALWDFKNKFSGIVGAIIDLTQLIAVEKFKDVLLESVPNPVYYLDRDMKYRGANVAYQKMVGLSEDHLVGRSRHDVFTQLCMTHEQFTPFIEEWEAKDALFLQQKLREQTFETKFYDVGREQYRDIIVFRTILTTATGNFDGVLSVMTDITEIRGVQRLKQNLFDVMPNPVYYKGSDLTYLEMNQAYCDVLGLPKSSVVGRTRNEVLAAARSELGSEYDDPIYSQHMKEIDDVMHRKDVELQSKPTPSVQVFEHELWSTVHRQFRQVIFYRRGVYGINGAFEGIIGSILDITELKTAITEAQTRKSQLEVLIDAVPDMIVFEDFTGRTVLRNKQAAAFLAHSSIAPHFTSKLVELKKELISKQSVRRTIEVEDPVTKTLQVFDVYKGIVKGAADFKILTVARDVTHIMDHQYQSTTMAGALNSVKSVVMIIDSRGKFIFANSAFYTNYGIDPAALIDIPAHIIVSDLPPLDSICEGWKGVLTIKGKGKHDAVWAELTKNTTSRNDYFTIVVEIKHILGDENEN